VLGNKTFAQKGYATGAMSKMLTIGFTQLCLGAISARIVEHHYAIGLVERLDFRYVGRQRQCHHIGGRRYDRLLFDLLAVEHKEFRHVPRAGYAGTSAADLLVHES
jgi:RimJ/RimL family protein N-acetyltransferase